MNRILARLQDISDRIRFSETTTLNVTAIVIGAGAGLEADFSWVNLVAISQKESGKRNVFAKATAMVSGDKSLDDSKHISRFGDLLGKIGRIISNRRLESVL